MNVLTVDVEEWFHICGVDDILAPRHWDSLPSRVESTTLDLLELLERTRARATFFVLGWVAERQPEIVGAIQRAGHEVGSHGYGHRRAYELGPDDFRADVRKSLRALASAGASNVTAFRAPEWSINDRSPWALDTLTQEGFRADSSMAPVKIVGDTRYSRVSHVRQTAAGPILEVPPLVCNRFGQVMPIGWGWGLRMSSPQRVLRTIDGANRSGFPAVLAVHPWELDPDPPQARLPLRLHFAHYFKLRGFRERLREVLSGTTFGPLSEITAHARVS